ncbi:uncharacterized protein LOC117565366 [Drosophila albomicans]|uniref:Uncharacterized protein LOC117565366 n=1 Tax=Drosophila albomicans TaxID=7291 RepID=A0A6P8XQ25_DROAB|nr:uncharacterized protein LOC117565366 [Drosophila albomicans]
MSEVENKRGPKHMRLRYYTSYEEASVLKLWREHLNEITSYTENLQIFREIAFGLQQHRIRLNKQEVRRRISSYRNKYLIERSRLESDPEYKSHWRLYPLISSLFPSTTQESIILPEYSALGAIEAKVRSELPSLPRFQRHDCKTMKFEQDVDGCPFMVGQFIKPEMLPQSTPSKLFSIKTEEKTCDEIEDMRSSPEKRIPFVSTFEYAGSARRIRRRSIMPRTGQITMAQIQMLRQENDLLVEQRDAHLADLQLKERQYQNLEQTFDFWLHQQETWMIFLDDRDLQKP